MRGIDTPLGRSCYSVNNNINSWPLYIIKCLLQMWHLLQFRCRLPAPSAPANHGVTSKMERIKNRSVIQLHWLSRLQALVRERPSSHHANHHISHVHYTHTNTQQKCAALAFSQLVLCIAHPCRTHPWRSGNINKSFPAGEFRTSLLSRAFSRI